jgi:hypothetical protein
MQHILIIVQGLAYSALVVSMLSNRLGRGPAGILAAAGGLAALHGLLTLLVPPEWRVNWLVFWVPGHIITPLVLLWMRRKRD